MSSYSESGRQGWVYVLSSDSLRTLDGKPILKIGATRKHPIQRARELGAGTGVPTEYKLAYYRDFSDCFAAETLIHEQLDSVRVNQSREFFEVDTATVIDLIDRLASNGEAALESAGLTGGDQTQWRPAKLPPTPWAELFASFDPDGPPELSAAEQAQCRNLEKRLARRRL